jgi:endonuclease/exonuclease/phosphatase family metal-dependent hydrolase
VKKRALWICIYVFGFIAGCKQNDEFVDVSKEPKTSAIQGTESPALSRETVADSTEIQKPFEKETQLSIFAWNVESGGADPKVVAQRLARLNDFDIVCLSEVHPDDIDTFTNAKGENFQAFFSKSGNEDRLQIIFNKKRFELLEELELSQYRDFILNSGKHRSPIVVRLRDRFSGKTMLVMVNHLARGDAKFRKAQAIGLREWARDQDVGIVNMGDFNMDFEFATNKGNDALEEILRDNIWKWVQPKTWVDSNWWDPEGDGQDNFDGSLLDFAFVAGPAKGWSPSCEVLVEAGDFPDDATTSDHRPISLRLKLP